MSDDNKLSYAVKKYLQKNPDFFAQNPELLTELEVVNRRGELADLTTHQLKALQKENRKLKAQLTQLIANAQQSETLMNRLLSLLSELTLIGEDEFLSGFVKNVVKHFPSDYFKILLAEGLCETSIKQVDSLTEAQKSQFSVIYTQSQPLSGRLKSEQVNSIFAGCQDIKSAIVLPIGSQAVYGLMSFASKDEEKFHPHSSTDILQKLSQILANYFSQEASKSENGASPPNDVNESPSRKAQLSP